MKNAGILKYGSSSRGMLVNANQPEHRQAQEHDQREGIAPDGKFEQGHGDDSCGSAALSPC